VPQVKALHPATVITPTRKHMVTNTDKPVGPGTFTRGGNSVTIAEDGKILVRKDDWLSKYSYALYGDYKTLDVFVRPDPPFRSSAEEIKGIKEIDNVDRITTGEYLIHVPTYFSWADKRRKPRLPWRRPYDPRPFPGTPPAPPAPSPDSNRLRDFLRFLGQCLTPETDWKFVTSSGVDISADVFAAHICSIGIQRPTDPEPTWLRAVGAGFGLGPEDIAGSITISRPEYFSAGWVGKSVLVGRSLSVDEICGNYLLLDFGVGCIDGKSWTALFFGFNIPPVAILRNAVRYFRGESSGWPILPSLCHGALFMKGNTATTPAFGISFKGGLIYRESA
jgi:hypothetical protein